MKSSTPNIVTKNKKLVVVGLDFGTTGTGYGFKVIVSTSGEIQMNTKWDHIDIPYFKTHSCLLYKGTTLKSFAGTAIKDYEDLNDHEKANYTLIKEFKSFLKLNEENWVSPNNTTFKIVDIVGDYIRNFKDLIISHIENSMKKVKDEEIRWVVSVPSCWDENTIQKYKKALLRAKIIKDINASEDDLLIITEPEAAGVHCFVESSNPLRNDDVFIIVDAGGGTVDITCHKVANRQLKELTITRGSEKCGSTSINHRFLSYLEKLIGTNEFTNYKTQSQTDYYDLEKNFEKDKRNLTEYTKRIISIDKELIDLLDNSHITRNKLLLQEQELKDIFSPTFKEVLDLIQEVYDEVSKDHKVDYIYLVGGLNQNQILFNLIKSRFNTSVVFCPNYAGGSVIKGCVLLGLDPSYIRTRKSRLTYGIEGKMIFDPDKHNFDYCEYIDLLKDYYNVKVFDIFVQRNEDVPFDKVITKTYQVDEKEKKTLIKIYNSIQLEPKYIDEKNVNLLGSIEVSNESSYGLDLTIDMKFGKATIGISIKNSKGVVVPFEVKFESKIIEKL